MDRIGQVGIIDKKYYGCGRCVLPTSTLQVIEGAIFTIAFLDRWGYSSLILGGQVVYYHPMPPPYRMFREKKTLYLGRAGVVILSQTRTLVSVKGFSSVSPCRLSDCLSRSATGIVLWAGERRNFKTQMFQDPLIGSRSIFLLSKRYNSNESLISQIPPLALLQSMT